MNTNCQKPEPDPAHNLGLNIFPGAIILEFGGCLHLPRNQYAGFIADPPIPRQVPHTITPYRDAQSGILNFNCPIDPKIFPYAADFVEFFRRFGFRFNLPPEVHPSAISPSSLVYLIHPRACLNNSTEIRPYYLNPDLDQFCFVSQSTKSQNFTHLEDNSIQCSRDWWADAPANHSILYTERVPCYLRNFRNYFQYQVFPQPVPAFIKPEFTPGIIAFAPITSVCVLVDQKTGKGRSVFEELLLNTSSIPASIQYLN